MSRRVKQVSVLCGIVVAVTSLALAGMASSGSGASRKSAFAADLARLRATIPAMAIESVEDMQRAKQEMARAPASMAARYSLSRADYLSVYEDHLKSASEAFRQGWPDLFESTQPHVGFEVDRGD